MSQDTQNSKPATIVGKRRWENLNIAFENFRAYIARKSEPSALTLVDLLHASNFKGGNASITDPEDQVNSRLQHYAAILDEIQKEFGSRRLGDLNEHEKARFIKQAKRFIELPTKGPTHISGLGPSYASALLAAHLPDLATVIDRNVLVGAGIIDISEADDQVQDIERYYGALICFLYQRLKTVDANSTLRELDKVLFIAGSGLLKTDQ
jgi:hypothetical protein